MSVLATTRASLASSIGIARERLRAHPGRTFLNLVLQAVVILLVGRLIPGVLVDDALAAFLGAAVIALLNALVRPVLILLTLPLSVATFGLVSLVINATIVVLAAPIVPGLAVAGFLPAFALAIVLTIATTSVNVILAVDDDEAFYTELARRIGQVDAPTLEPGAAGLVIIQIDGLAAPILRNAIRVGLVPTLARWVRSGTHHLASWECPPPSQTSASQAGILHGDNHDIPAFRWYEKESGRLLVSNRPADAEEIERRVSTAPGLLHPAGTSVGNLFSGDAARSAFVMSRMRDPIGSLDVDAFSLYFVDPAAFVRTILLTASEFVKELLEARRQRNLRIEPRVHRGAVFAILRAATNVVLRDLNTTFVVRSMALGAPVIYVDLVDYDEIAHHAGPERLESLRALTGIDRVVASLERTARDAPRDYRFVLLSDHGQSQGATFRQRTGRTLEELISALMGGDPTVMAATGRTESYGPVNALLTELVGRRGVTGTLTGRALHRRTHDGTVELGEPVDHPGAGSAERPELVVCASGNLANIYFGSVPERLSAEAIEDRYPGLLGSLADHPGIGFVMVRTERGGAVVLGPSGARVLADDRVIGEDPLAPFGPNAADHLRRLDGFPHVGDLLVNSSYDPDLAEVAAFEELVGSHGGLGGPQNEPFLMAPTELALPREALVGAPAVHRVLRGWADQLGIETAVPAATAAPIATRVPRGLRFVAAWFAIEGVLLATLGVVAFIAGASEHGLRTELGSQAGLVALVLLTLGLAALATAIGIWRRRRWAWLTALALNTLSVLQVLYALATGGLAGIVSYGVLGAVVSVFLFSYLTRPHVAAAFGRRLRPRRSRGRRWGSEPATRTDPPGTPR